jgi:hypothetical protein
MVLAWLLQFASLTDKEISAMPGNLATLGLTPNARDCARTVGPAEVAIIKTHLRREESAALWNRNTRRRSVASTRQIFRGGITGSRKVRLVIDRAVMARTSAAVAHPPGSAIITALVRRRLVARTGRGHEAIRLQHGPCVVV